ncbi:hypothetical protein CRUP_010476 [Coryphaenoides rupestris]|nr:hypothetical protein CRUP_010476 [Coryphaenoides rupestris]
MESLETIAEVKRSAEDPGRNAAQIKCSSCEPPAPQTEGDPPGESEGGGRGLRQPQEDASVQQPCSHPGTDPLAVDPAIKAEALKSQKPGRYVCDYCGRACAKPSVLKKHIRSHTGERPYPCLPCGFSFKTKSNLYKHRKSHAHLVKAGSGSELGPYGSGMDQGSFEGEAELYSDGDQTTDTDDDGDPLLLLDSPTEAGSDSTAVKVLNLIAQKKGGGTSMVAQEVSPHLQEVTAATSPAVPPSGRAIQSSAVKQRLALRLSEKRSSESEQNLSLPSQSSKGSTDSGYFSRSESAEHQAGPPNTNAKSYQEIMFGKCYRPSPKQMTAFAIVGSKDASSEQSATTTRSERGVSRVFTQEKDVVDSIKINTKTYAREEMAEGAQLEGGSDMGPLLRSNSMPTSSAAGLAVPPCLRGSHSFDERSTTGGMRRLRRQAAFEHSVHEGHADADSHGKVPESRVECGMEGTMSGASHQKHAMELATRKRRKEKREEEDALGLYDALGEACEEITRFPDSIKDYDMKGAMGLLALGKGVCLHAQMDRGDMELSVDAQTSGRKAVPEIRVTVEPDSPEKAPEVKAKEPERQVEVEFQWPQRSETLAQFPPEKLPPKKKRLRLADIEHSSGESSFESACTSLSRSPSQDSNLSYSSAFSFDREESLKSLSPARQDEFGRPLELLAVPGSGHALSLLHQRQQHEMRRSSSEQAPCDLRKELPEVRSVSFDYGSLTSASKVRLADISTGPSAARERRRGNLVRQESLNMDTELTQQLVPSKIIPQFPGSVHPFAPTALLPPTLAIFATGTYQSPPSMLVPVRVHTHLPSYSSMTYTTVSQILDNQCDTMDLLTASSTTGSSHNQLRLFGNLDPTIVVVGDGRLALNVDALDLSSAKLKTGIPLSLTSRTISTTNASSGGTNKRMLSPASSLDLFIEVKQQKRVKEEKMFGQIVEELSAVELGKCNLAEDNRQGSEMQVFSSARGRDERSQQSKFISSLRRSAPEIISDSVDSAMDSSASERSTPSYSAATPPGEVDVDSCGEDTKVPMDTAHDSQPVARRDALISDDVRQLRLRPSSQFPSLRTTTGVSWCFLNYTKPSGSVAHSVGGGGDKAGPVSSVYATWCVSLHNPNPPEVSTSTALALLRSRQRQGGGEALYTMAAMCQPGAGKLVSSLILWRQKMEQLQRKPEIKEEEAVAAAAAGGAGPMGPTGAGPTAVAAYGKKAKDTGCRPRTAKEEWKEREATLSQALPNRIKIFEGGSGVVFRDVLWNLTKHMKSKAHMKKCLEMGVSVSVDDIEIQEVEGGAQQESSKSGLTVGVAKAPVLRRRRLGRHGRGHRRRSTRTRTTRTTTTAATPRPGAAHAAAARS